jgi:hypothetical protein
MAEEIKSVVKKRGWSGKNIWTGLGLLFVGFIIWFADSVVMGFASGIAGKKFTLGFWGGLGFLLMAFGILGYWIAIPAFQKWWRTKRWLALIFLVPSILLGIMVIVAVLHS